MKKAVLRTYMVLMTLALVAFLCAIPRAHTPRTEELPVLPAAHEEKKVEKEPIAEREAQTPSEAEVQKAPIPTPEREITKLFMPVNGTIINTFSKTPVYSPSMGDWRAHLGVDIGAPKAYRVYAAAKGMVKSVSETSDWGVVIEIEHAGNLKTVYKNLSTDIMAKEGDKVEAGDAISGVGDGAAMESAEGAHLHFEVYKDGEAVDPTAYFD